MLLGQFQEISTCMCMIITNRTVCKTTQADEMVKEYTDLLKLKNTIQAMELNYFCFILVMVLTVLF